MASDRLSHAPGESRNGHFADAVARISGRLAAGGYSDGTDGNASIDHHDKVGRPLNGMMDEPDIPRFGADEIDYGY